MRFSAKTFYAIGVTFWALTIIWLELGLVAVVALAAMADLGLRVLERRAARPRTVEVRRRK